MLQMNSVMFVLLEKSLFEKVIQCASKWFGTVLIVAFSSSIAVAKVHFCWHKCKNSGALLGLSGDCGSTLGRMCNVASGDNHHGTCPQ